MDDVVAVLLICSAALFVGTISGFALALSSVEKDCNISQVVRISEKVFDCKPRAHPTASTR